MKPIREAKRGMRRTITVAAIAASLIASACTSDQPPPPEDAGAEESAAVASARSTGQAPFDFAAPAASMPLDPELKEISDLTVLPDGNIAAVQDENGMLYVLDENSGAIQQKIQFEEGADFEGVELAGDRMFALQSNGTILEIENWQSGNPQVRTYETHLKSKNDTESIGYDAAHNRLLIGTKEDPGQDIDNDLKGFYAFDLSTNTLSDKPVFTINENDVEGQLSGDDKFKPSALAVQPSTGNIYVLSSVAKVIVAVDPSGAIRHVWPLSEDLFEQPEGLAFLPGGDLLISSEGVDGPAMLYRIKRVAGS
ncbi:MAG TPA: SdiA-regulated domain-containing protein [Rhodothermales bacterium]|nr:SdiA-regulated domain-containing protein [Rhodothermales bacterium]